MLGILGKIQKNKWLDGGDGSQAKGARVSTQGA
jgi:hypothetical protein